MYINLSGGYIPFKRAYRETPTSFTDLPLLMDKYSSDELSNYNEIIKFATPNSDDGKEFFRIKILDDNIKKRRKGMNEYLPQFWTPRPHVNLNSSQDIVNVLDGIVKDIYNYPSIKEQEKIQENLSEKKLQNDKKTLSLYRLLMKMIMITTKY